MTIPKTLSEVKTNYKQLWVLVLLGCIVYACKKGSEAAPDLFPGFTRPANFPEPVYDFSRNPVTKDGFELGKRLFYEPRLSRNNTIACGSCHIQSASFTHHGHDVSHGIDDRLGTRNPQPIVNMAWQKEFFWDGGVFHLDLSPVNAITSPVEMDETVPNVLRKLREHPEYPALFKKAFGTDQITDEYFFKALSQFMVMAVSANSRYDQVMRRENGTAFTDAEQKGYVFFRENCGSCHQEPLFTDLSYRNNGLAPNRANDTGRDSVTLNPADRYKFKVPSLRNWQYTAPYMHDGRFLTLNRMLEHYRNGVTDSETLDPVFRQPGGTPGIPMTEEEKEHLTAFLQTLNDREFVTNPLLSEPELGGGMIVK